MACRGRAGAGRVDVPSPLTPSSVFCLRPDGLMYQKFRNQFLSFSMYQSECLRGPCSAQDLSIGRGRERTWGSSSALTPFPPGFVQFLQYYYQSGCLYRLRALGERHTMDLTVGEWGMAPHCGSQWGCCEGKSFPLELRLDGVSFCPWLFCALLLFPLRGLPVLDVARPHLPAAFSFLWTCKLYLCPCPSSCAAPALA